MPFLVILGVAGASPDAPKERPAFLAADVFFEAHRSRVDGAPRSANHLLGIDIGETSPHRPGAVVGRGLGAHGRQIRDLVELFEGSPSGCPLGRRQTPEPPLILPLRGTVDRPDRPPRLADAYPVVEGSVASTVNPRVPHLLNLRALELPQILRDGHISKIRGPCRTCALSAEACRMSAFSGPHIWPSTKVHLHLCCVGVWVCTPWPPDHFRG